MELAERAEKVRRTRGLLLGLSLGGTVGALGGNVPGGAEPLRATAATQLACFTTEGLIRAHFRQSIKGISNPPGMVWFSLMRWAEGQGLPIPQDVLKFFADSHYPNGWLSTVPVLRERRGSARATVSAINTGQQGTRREPGTNSHGAHALVRALPVSTFPSTARDMYDLAANVAALTHGPTGYLVAAEGAVLAAAFADSDNPQTAVSCALLELSFSEGRQPNLDRYAKAANDAVNKPGEPPVLAGYASGWSADAVLSAALYTAASFPGRDQVRDALRFAATGVDGSSVAAVTGALLGAMHGADALPGDWVSRLELAWVVDTLARDLVVEIVDSPGGCEVWPEPGDEPGIIKIGWQNGTEPDWYYRYPPG